MDQEQRLLTKLAQAGVALDKIEKSTSRWIALPQRSNSAIEQSGDASYRAFTKASRSHAMPALQVIQRPSPALMSWTGARFYRNKVPVET